MNNLPEQMLSYVAEKPSLESEIYIKKNIEG